MEILAYIEAHWVEWLFTLCLAGLTFAYKTLLTRMKAEQKKNEAIADGIQALLRESIVTNYNKYKQKRYCPIFAKESLKKVYASYAALGGNDVATGLYKELLEMPTEKEDAEHDEQ